MSRFLKWILILAIVLMVSAGGFFLLEQKTGNESYQHLPQVAPIVIDTTVPPGTSTPAVPSVAPFHLPSDIKTIKIGGAELVLDLALTPATQAQGLSGRKSIASDAGMLFVFSTPSKYSFWMKDMDFSIDMIWLDASGTIVYIQKNATPQSYPKTFTPTTDASYVLEVATGFSAKHNLKVGDQTEFTY